MFLEFDILTHILHINELSVPKERPILWYRDEIGKTIGINLQQTTVALLEKNKTNK